MESHAEGGLTHRVCGVIAGRDEDDVPRIAVDKQIEELLVVISWQRSHNVSHGPGTEWPPSSSDGGRNHHLTDTGDTSVRLRGKCGDRLCNHSGRGRASTALAHRDAWLSGALSRVYALHPHFLRGEGGEPAEAIDMGLGFPLPMLYCEVVLLQRCRPAVEEC